MLYLKKTSKQVVEALNKAIAVMGPPAILQSDNGRELKNKMLLKT